VFGAVQAAEKKRIQTVKKYANKSESWN